MHTARVYMHSSIQSAYNRHPTETSMTWLRLIYWPPSMTAGHPCYCHIDFTVALDRVDHSRILKRTNDLYSASLAELSNGLNHSWPVAPIGHHSSIVDWDCRKIRSSVRRSFPFTLYTYLHSSLFSACVIRMQTKRQRVGSSIDLFSAVKKFIKLCRYYYIVQTLSHIVQSADTTPTRAIYRWIRQKSHNDSSADIQCMDDCLIWLIIWWHTSHEVISENTTKIKW